MNKIILALALVAAVGVVVAQAEYTYDTESIEDNEVERASAFDRLKSVMFKGDDDETANLSEEDQDLKAFCTTVRDDTKKWFSGKINTSASELVKKIGGFVTGTAKEISEKGEQAVQQGTEMVATDAKAIVDALKLLVNSIGGVLEKNAGDLVQQVKEGKQAPNFKNHVEDACYNVSQLKRELDGKFNQVRSKVNDARRKSGKSEFSRGWTSLDCVTVKRVKVANIACTVMNAIVPMLD